MTHPRRGERGQVILLYTIALTAMCGIVGLGVDLGWMKFRQRAAQEAADAAALAAAKASLGFSGNYCGVQIVCQGPTACSATVPGSAGTTADSACIFAKANGFTATGKQNVTVESNASPATPPTASGTKPGYWVTVRTTEKVFQLFSAVMGNTQGLVAARSTAGIVPPGGAGCVYALALSGQKALYYQGALNTNCGLYVNSNDASDALDCQGTISGTFLKVRGGHAGSCSPLAPTLLPQPVTDPMANTPPPATPAGCNNNNAQVSSNATLNPGTYCGGIYIGQNTTVTLNPGTYYLKGGGLFVNQGTLVKGTGVTFVQTGLASGGQPLGWNMTQGNAEFKAPTSGPLEGILWYSRGNGNILNQIEAHDHADLEGLIYTPSEDWIVRGQSTINQASSPKYTAWITNTIDLQGNWTIGNDYTGLASGSLFHTVALLE